MQDVAPGRTIGGRYTLNERRLASADGVEAWSATDAHLQAEVTITLLESESATSPAVLDAARRAAHVQDHRLVRILDVGEGGGLSWIVEEHHPGTRTLVDVVEDNPLSGERTRTVVGEAASALAVAARRGMHHLRLTPYSVLLTSEGEVKVSGLGTVLALDGAVEPPRERAERLDALGLLGLAYYAMTTRWPLPAEVPGILPAPRVVSGVPAPSEIAAGVPADLDMLCRMALNGQAGPAGPEHLASEIAPWRPWLVEGMKEAPAPATTMAPLPAPVPVTAPPQSPGDAAGAVRAPSPAPHTRPDTSPATAPLPTRMSAAAGAAAAAGTAAGETVGKLGTFARAAADKAQLKREEAAARRAAERAETQRREHAVHLSDLQQEQSHEVGAGAASPLWPFEAEAKPGSHSRFVLAVIAGVCVMSFLLATFVVMNGLRRGETAPTVATGAPKGGAASTTVVPSPVVPAKPVTIVRGVSVDPDGDGSENDNQIPRAYDGEATTRWASEQYRSDPEWGGAANRGVGLAFRLATPTALKGVRLTFGDRPQSGTLYVGPSPQLSGATKVGTFADATGTRQVDLASAPQAAYVIVWFTKATRDGSSYRVSLNEIVPLG